MLVRHLIAIVLVVGIGGDRSADAFHPQDGPHADLRITIEDDLVRFAVGVNLAFLDQVIDSPREALGDLSDSEADRTLERFRQLLADQAPCVINGESIEPVFERLEIFADPDPGMVAVFPKMGNRALIRAAAVLRFDSATPAETVEITWPAYPLDQLAEQLERGAGAHPRMYFEVIFTAEGRTSAARFTHAEPTIAWSRSDASEFDPQNDLPTPAAARSGVTSPVWYAALGVGVLAASGLVVTRRSAGARAGAVAAALVVIGVGVALKPRAASRQVISDDDARAIFLSIHESMYRAFDYTAESDIYDRLSLALDGDLLGEMYEQIRLSLLQAEEEMKVGIVTGLEALETEVDKIDTAKQTSAGVGFSVNHRWRVDGTVYHWGHSHTRAHIYEASYRISFTDGGWRITEHRLRSHQRINPDGGDPLEQDDPLQRVLDQLGQPDI